MRTSKSGFFSLQGLSLLLIVVNSVLQFQGIWDFRNLSLVLFAIWLIITSFAFSNTFSRVLSEKRFIALGIFIVFYFLSSLFVHSVSVSFNRCFALLNILSPILMYEVVRLQSVKFKKTYIVFLCVIIVLNIFISFSTLKSIGVNNLRLSHSEYSTDYYIINKVFDLCYSLAIAIPCFIEIIRKTRLKKLSLILLSSLCILFVYYIIIAQYATAVIVSLALGLVFLFSNKRNGIIAPVISIVLITQLFVLLYPSFQSISSDRFSELNYRLGEVYMVLTGNRANSMDINSRSNLSVLSLTTFIQHPFFGVNHIINIKDSQEIYVFGIGNHASWLDSLAQYGIFAIFLLYFIWVSLKNQRKELGILAPSVALIILGFLNPILNFHEICTTFLIMPLVYTLFVRQHIK